MILCTLIPEESEHGHLSSPQLVILGHDPAGSALMAADVRSTEDVLRSLPGSMPALLVKRLVGIWKQMGWLL